MSDKVHYIYEGPVVMFGKCAESRWVGETWATSKQKALSNLAFQWKRRNNQTAYSAPVSFPGKLTVKE